MKIWQWLGYLGLIPFIVWLFFPSLITTHWNILPEQGFIFYSVIILSFLSGSLWRKGTLPSSIRSQLISIFFSLFAYLCLLLSLSLSVILLPIGYLGLLASEYLLCNTKKDANTYQYLRMRSRLTFFVILLHFTAVIIDFL